MHLSQFVEPIAKVLFQAPSQADYLVFDFCDISRINSGGGIKNELGFQLANRTRYHKAYASAQTHAKRSELGMWAGSFVEPWRYRECVKIGGGISACSDI